MRVAIVLAAGESRRWGLENKLLAPIGGRPLVAHAVAAAREAPVGRILVVVGAQRVRVAAAVRGPRVTVIRARDYGEGLGASVRTGLSALRPAERLAFIFLGDMAALPRHLPARLLRTLQPGDPAVRPVWRGVPGHPVLLRKPVGPLSGAVRGDRGLGPLLRGARLLPSARGAILDLDRRTESLRLRSARSARKGNGWKSLPDGSRPPRR